MHTKDIGSLGELRVAAALVEKGYSVFTELGDNSKIDLIAVNQDDYSLIKLQVKCFSTENGRIEIRSSKSAHGYKFDYESKHADFFVLYAKDEDEILYIPSAKLLGKKCLTIRFKEPKNLQRDKINWYEDYLEFNP